MQHRHLLPNEIDLLVDGESGFGVQPLREHVRDCSHCRARLTEAQQVVAALAEVPLLSPRMGMADRVMSQVPVYVPWHVSARDSVVAWVPTGRTARVLAAALVAVVGSLVTGLTLLLAAGGDMLAIFTGLLGEEARVAVTNAAGDLVLALFGPQMIAAIQQVGPIGIGLAAAGFVVASFATVLGLRHIAASSRARS